jgi:large subunit ribosomal protein L25
MREMQELRAEPRANLGKGGSYRVRQSGFIPAIIYGGTDKPQPVQVEERAFAKHYYSGLALSTLFMLEIGGKKTRVIPRDIQLDPVTDRPVHVDFMRLEAGSRIALNIPVHFKGHEASPGLKLGGVVNIVRHEIEFYCPVDNIPAAVEVDLAGLEIGDSVHISAIALPEGVKPVIQNRDFTVATIAAPSTYTEEAVQAVAAEGQAAAGGEGAAAAGEKKPAEKK